MGLRITSLPHRVDNRGGIAPRFLLLSIFFSLSCVASAAVVKMDREELAQRSDLIVCGSVIRADANRHAIVAVEEVLKGKWTQQRLPVRYAPGLAESAAFTGEERVLLFLVRVAPQEFVTVGGFQGKVSLGPAERCSLLQADG
jgi:hypothetical protein